MLCIYLWSIVLIPNKIITNLKSNQKINIKIQIKIQIQDQIKSNPLKSDPIQAKKRTQNKISNPIQIQTKSLHIQIQIEAKPTGTTPIQHIYI